MKTLYVIGNGFDIHHGLDTQYRSFGLFLKKNYGDIYDKLIEYYGFSELKETPSNDEEEYLWSEFEYNLSKLNKDTVFENHEHSLASPGSASFRDRDWHAFSIDMELIVDALTEKLSKAFTEFILNVEYPLLNPILKLHLSENAHFLTFNYTNTLERYYHINPDHITYIHEKAVTPNDRLVLGHGILPENFSESEKEPPPNMDEEDLEQWFEDRNNEYDYSFESGKEVLWNYFDKTHKKTKDVLDKHATFFENLSKVERINILGHSLADVDLPYLEKIICSVSKNAYFKVSYYSESSKNFLVNQLKKLGISDENFELIRLDD